MNDLRGLLLLILFGLPLIATTNLECRTNFKCLDETHFHICVDFGDGILRAIDTMVFPCPSRMVCDETNKNECHIPIKPTTTQISTTVNEKIRTTLSETTTSATTTASENNNPISLDSIRTESSASSVLTVLTEEPTQTIVSSTTQYNYTKLNDLIYSTDTSRSTELQYINKSNITDERTESTQTVVLTTTQQYNSTKLHDLVNTTDTSTIAEINHGEKVNTTDFPNAKTDTAKTNMLTTTHQYDLENTIDTSTTEEIINVDITTKTAVPNVMKDTTQTIILPAIHQNTFTKLFHPINTDRLLNGSISGTIEENEHTFLNITIAISIQKSDLLTPNGFDFTKLHNSLNITNKSTTEGSEYIGRKIAFTNSNTAETTTRSYDGDEAMDTSTIFKQNYISSTIDVPDQNSNIPTETNGFMTFEPINKMTEERKQRDKSSTFAITNVTANTLLETTTFTNTHDIDSENKINTRTTEESREKYQSHTSKVLNMLATNELMHVLHDSTQQGQNLGNTENTSVTIENTQIDKSNTNDFLYVMTDSTTETVVFMTNKEFDFVKTDDPVIKTTTNLTDKGEEIYIKNAHDISNIMTETEFIPNQLNNTAQHDLNFAEKKTIQDKQIVLRNPFDFLFVTTDTSTETNVFTTTNQFDFIKSEDTVSKADIRTTEESKQVNTITTIDGSNIPDIVSEYLFNTKQSKDTSTSGISNVTSDRSTVRTSYSFDSINLENTVNVMNLSTTEESKPTDHAFINVKTDTPKKSTPFMISYFFDFTKLSQPDNTMNTQKANKYTDTTVSSKLLTLSDTSTDIYRKGKITTAQNIHEDTNKITFSNSTTNTPIEKYVPYNSRPAVNELTTITNSTKLFEIINKNVNVKATQAKDNENFTKLYHSDTTTLSTEETILKDNVKQIYRLSSDTSMNFYKSDELDVKTNDKSLFTDELITKAILKATTDTSTQYNSFVNSNNPVSPIDESITEKPIHTDGSNRNSVSKVTTETSTETTVVTTKYLINSIKIFDPTKTTDTVPMDTSLEKNVYFFTTPIETYNILTTTKKYNDNHISNTTALLDSSTNAAKKTNFYDSNSTEFYNFDNTTDTNINGVETPTKPTPTGVAMSTIFLDSANKTEAHTTDESIHITNINSTAYLTTIPIPTKTLNPRQLYDSTKSYNKINKINASEESIVVLINTKVEELATNNTEQNTSKAVITIIDDMNENSIIFNITGNANNNLFNDTKPKDVTKFHEQAVPRKPIGIVPNNLISNETINFKSLLTNKFNISRHVLHENNSLLQNTTTTIPSYKVEIDYTVQNKYVENSINSTNQGTNLLVNTDVTTELTSDKNTKEIVQTLDIFTLSIGSPSIETRQNVGSAQTTNSTRNSIIQTSNTTHVENKIGDEKLRINTLNNIYINQTTSFSTTTNKAETKNKAQTSDNTQTKKYITMSSSTSPTESTNKSNLIRNITDALKNMNEKSRGNMTLKLSPDLKNGERVSTHVTETAFYTKNVQSTTENVSNNTTREQATIVQPLNNLTLKLNNMTVTIEKETFAEDISTTNTKNITTEQINLPKKIGSETKSNEIIITTPAVLLRKTEEFKENNIYSTVTLNLVRTEYPIKYGTKSSISTDNSFISKTNKPVIISTEAPYLLKSITEFECVTEGRFSDIIKVNYYYICVKNNGSYVRFKFGCQNGYHVNKSTIKCELNKAVTKQFTVFPTLITHATQSPIEDLSRKIVTDNRTSHGIITIKNDNLPESNILAPKLEIVRIKESPTMIEGSMKKIHKESEDDTDDADESDRDVKPSIKLNKNVQTKVENREPMSVQLLKPQEMSNVEIFTDNLNTEMKHDMPIIVNIETIQSSTLSATSKKISTISVGNHEANVEDSTLSTLIVTSSPAISTLSTPKNYIELTRAAEPVTPKLDHKSITTQNKVTAKMPEITTSRVQNDTYFVCPNKKNAKYAENTDCRKFYICAGQDYPIVTECPIGTVFSDLKKQCTKNLSHCIRNNEFHCPSEGRFHDIFTDIYYYICVKDTNHFQRLKLRCQNGYHVNEFTLHCELNEENSEQSSVSHSSKDSSEKSTEEVKNEQKRSTERHRSKRRENSSFNFKCVEKGKFPDPENCTHYYVCSKHHGRIREKHKRCKKGKVFHKDRYRCVSAESYNCKSN